MLRSFASLLVLASLTPLAGAQTTRHVPSQYSTIQAGINAAVNGDTVLVAPGIYEEGNIRFFGKAITLKSSDGPELTRIDASQVARVMLIRDGEGRNTVVEGLTLEQGRPIPLPFSTDGGHGGGMWIESASPTIRNCVFSNNEAASGSGFVGSTGASGGAIFVADESNPLIENCAFRSNRAGDGRAGVDGEHGADSIFATIPGGDGEDGGDGGDGGSGGAIAFSSSQGAIVNCAFLFNQSGEGGRGGDGGWGGLGDLAIGGELFLSSGGDGGNGGDAGRGGDGSAILVDMFSSVEVVHCSFYANTAEEGGTRGDYGRGGDGFTDGDDGEYGASGGDGIGALTPLQIFSFEGELDVLNSIVWDNNGSGAPVTGGVVRNSNVQGGFPGSGNINQDPVWSTVFDNDERLRLLDGSPCIDTAVPTSFLSESDTDLDGNPRFFEHPFLGGGSMASPAPDMGAYEFVGGFALDFGCGTNPADSLTILAGSPILGDVVTFGVDNPLGTQTAGAIPVVFYSMTPLPDCGFLFPNYGMGAGPGAFLLDFAGLDGVVGAPWAGSGTPAPIDFALPNDMLLLGESVFVQGALVGGGGVGLAQGFELYIGA